MKAIMYHYVQEPIENLPHFKFLDVSEFRKQLDYFENLYGFVKKNDFLLSFKTGKVPKGVVLTFDDALMCHYSYVFKELKKRKIWGIFYIPSLPYSSGNILDVHRVHILLGSNPSKDIFEYMNSLTTQNMIDVEKYDEFLRSTYVFQNNDEYTTYIKRSLNYFISYKHRPYVLDLLMKEFVPNERDYIQDFYISKKQIYEMNECGMLIGSHSVDHSVMSRLSLTEQKEQITKSIDFLQNILGELRIRTFCYPYGGFSSFTKETEKMLSLEKFLFSFNVEHRDINANDLLRRPQALPRYDCNCFQHGYC